MANTHLPEDLIYTEIFSRLPTKFVGRCKCLSKTWRTRLSSSEFINLHFTRKPHQEHPVFLSDHCLHTVRSPTNIHAASCDKIQLHDKYSMILGSSNGLLMVCVLCRNMHLLNPITLQDFKVPVSTFGTIGSSCTYGFGYDSSTDDYKIVTIYFHLMSSRIIVEVYSLRRGFWKRWLINDFRYHIFDVRSGYFVNGAIHWLATCTPPRTEKVIVAFNLADVHVFHEIPTPVNMHSDGILVIRGYLSVVCDQYSFKYLDIWIMKDYGVAESWTKFFRLHQTFPQFHDVDVIPSFLDDVDDEFVLGHHSTGLVLFNMKARREMQTAVDGFYSTLCGSNRRKDVVYSFVDSLVSPNLLAGSKDHN